jgi:ribosomal protein L7/L12
MASRGDKVRPWGRGNSQKQRQMPLWVPAASLQFDITWGFLMKKYLHILPPILCAVLASGVQAQDARDDSFKIQMETEYDVILTIFGEQKTNVIEIVRAATGLGLKEARELDDGKPKTLKVALRETEAKALQQQLESAGAQVDIVSSAKSKGKPVIVVNKGAAPVTFIVNATGVVTATGESLRSNKTWPLTDVAAPNSTKEIARFFPKDADEHSEINLSYDYSVGNVFAKPDKNFKYYLPFEKGTEFRVAQEPGGAVITHKDDLSRYAIDLGVPEGTPVLAARAGTVIEVRDQFNEGRLDPEFVEKANLVSIVHSDGTFAQYVHLAQDGIRVHPGDHVEAGQVIAASGNTGYSAGPHLHFDLRHAVLKNGTVTQESIPFTFYHRGSGAKVTPKQKQRITVN